MKRSYKYRIYPNKLQREALQQIFWFCRFLYNNALEQRIAYYKRYQKSLSYNVQANELLEVKQMFATEVANIYSQTLQQTLKQLDASYQNFFRKLKGGTGETGFPRFKGEDRFRSICFPQCNLVSGLGGVKLLPNNKLKIYGLPGEVNMVLHRPWKGRCKQVRIVKQADQYYIVLSCEAVPAEPLASTGKTVAIDLGITNFITMDDGTVFHHPKPYKTSKEKLAFLNKRLSRKQRGSNSRRRALVAVQRAHQKVHDIRLDFQHKTAKRLVAENDVLIIEKLNVKGMLEAKGFEVNKSNIQDASWGSFATLLNYKAESAGRKIIEVDPRNTSKMCSSCSNVKQNLTLQDRIYCCDACGIAIDRDLNAALNIKRLGLSLAAGMPQKPSALC
jgi:putative transposase